MTIDNPEEDQQPQGFVEFIVPATAVVSGGKFAYDVRKDIKGAFKAGDPLSVSVLDTLTSDAGHELVIEIRNHGSHGVYIESLTLSDPDDLAVEVRGDHEARIGWETKPASESVEADWLPRLIPGGGKARARLLIAPFAERRLRNKPFGYLLLGYLVAGVAQGPKQKKVGFAVRPATGSANRD